MCANCKPVGLKLDGEKLITVYTPAPAEQFFFDPPFSQRFIGHGPDYEADTMDYVQSRAEQR